SFSCLCVARGRKVFSYVYSARRRATRRFYSPTALPARSPSIPTSPCPIVRFTPTRGHRNYSSCSSLARSRPCLRHTLSPSNGRQSYVDPTIRCTFRGDPRTATGAQPAFISNPIRTPKQTLCFQFNPKPPGPQGSPSISRRDARKRIGIRRHLHFSSGAHRPARCATLQLPPHQIDIRPGTPTYTPYMDEAAKLAPFPLMGDADPVPASLFVSHPEQANTLSLLYDVSREI